MEHWIVATADMLIGRRKAPGLDASYSQPPPVAWCRQWCRAVSVWCPDGLRRLVQTKARHSDINLTMQVYSHVELEDQNAAIAALPGPPRG